MALIENADDIDAPLVCIDQRIHHILTGEAEDHEGNGVFSMLNGFNQLCSRVVLWREECPCL